MWLILCNPSRRLLSSHGRGHWFNSSRARKAQAEAIAAVAQTISKSIGRVVSSSLGSLRDHWHTQQQIQRLSYLTPRVLDDIGISHEIRARALQVRRQPSRLPFYL